MGRRARICAVASRALRRCVLACPNAPACDPAGLTQVARDGVAMSVDRCVGWLHYAMQHQAMKRSGPLQRRTPLRSKPASTETPDPRRKPVLALRPPGAPSVNATMNWQPNWMKPAAVAVKLPSGGGVRRHASRSDRSADEAEYLGRVKELACVLCEVLGLEQDGPTEAHHLRAGQGGGQRAMDWLAAALCRNRCHQGVGGIHGDRSLLRRAKCTEIDLLGWTIAKLNGARIVA